MIRNLEVLGEAANKISEGVKDNSTNINWFQLRGLRNRIVHDYVGIDYNIIWDVSANRLGTLEGHLQELLKKL